MYRDTEEAYTAIEKLLARSEEIENRIEEIENEIFLQEEQISDLKGEDQEIGDKINEIEIWINDRPEMYDTQGRTDIEIDFIKASKFAARYKTRKVLQHVYIDNKNFIACDGYRICVVNNTNIPDNLQGKYIPWEAREDILEKATDVKGEYINYKNAFNNITDSIEEMTIKELEKMIYKEEHEKDTIVYLDIFGLKIAFKKKYFIDVIRLFDNEDLVKVYKPCTCHTPLVVMNHRVKALVCPMRVSEY